MRVSELFMLQCRLARRLLCIICFALVSASSAGQTTILLTADLEGHAGPAGEDLARLASVVQQVRQKEATLLLDAGNSLIGGEALGSRGKIVVAAYELLKYDAVNLSYRDFWFGKERTVSLLKDAKAPFISANLLDAESGALLAKPYVTREIGKERIAVLGVTEAPAAMNRLPHLAQQLAGIRIELPVEAVAKWLPKAKAESDRVVLLYYGSTGGLDAIRQKHGEGLAAILVGGLRPEYLPTDAKPPIVGTGARGEQLAQVRFAGHGKKTKVEVTQLPVGADVKCDPEMLKLLAAYLEPTPGPEMEAPATAESGRAALLPASLTLNQTYPLYSVHGNRAVRLTVNDVAIMDEYGTQSPQEGRRLLVVNTEWENVIPLTLISEREMSTIYLVPNLGDHLYLVVDGGRLCRLHPDAGSLPGHVPATDLRLERIGSTLRGNIVFEVPPARVETLELRFYDYAHGHMAIPLKKRPPEAKVVEEKPIVSPQANQFLEVGVYGMETAEEVDGEEAPNGMEYVLLDVRARCLFTFEADATAYDPAAEEGDVIDIGTVADWKESRTYLHLVADGEYAYGADEHTALDEEPRFLPDVMTGDWVVFLAPKDTRSLELRCDFPVAYTPGSGWAFQPEPLTFLLKGEPPEPPEREAIVSIDDVLVDVAVVGQQVTDEFAGAEADEDTEFLVLEIVVESTSEKGEFFQTQEQLQYVREDGEQVELDDLTYQGIRRPTEVVWIPKGERRAFQVVFRIPDAETKPRLAYRGYTLAKVVKLAPIDE